MSHHTVSSDIIQRLQASRKSLQEGGSGRPSTAGLKRKATTTNAVADTAASASSSSSSVVKKRSRVSDDAASSSDALAAARQRLAAGTVRTPADDRASNRVKADEYRQQEAAADQAHARKRQAAVAEQFKRSLIDFNDPATNGRQTLADLHKASRFQSATAAEGAAASAHATALQINLQNKMLQQAQHRHKETRGVVRKLVGYIASSKDRQTPKTYVCEEGFMVAAITPLKESELRAHYGGDLPADDNFQDKVLVSGYMPYVLPSAVYDLKVQETFHQKFGWQWVVSECLTRPRVEEAKYLRQFMKAVLLHDLSESDELHSLTKDEVELKKVELKKQIVRDSNQFLREAARAAKAAAAEGGAPGAVMITADEYINKNWRGWLETLPYGGQLLQACVTKEASVGKLYPLINLCYDGKALSSNNPWWRNMSEGDKSRWENALKDPETAMRLCFRETFPDGFKFQGTFVQREMAKNRERRKQYDERADKPFDAEDQHQRDALDLEYLIEELNLLEASTHQTRHHGRATCIPSMRAQGFRELCSRMNWVAIDEPVMPHQIVKPPVHLPTLHRHLPALDAYEKYLELVSEPDASCCTNRRQFSEQHHLGLDELVARGILRRVRVGREDYSAGHTHPETFDAQASDDSATATGEPCCDMLVSSIWSRCKTHLARMFYSFRAKFEASKSSKAFQLQWDKFVLPRKHRAGCESDHTLSLEEVCRLEDLAKAEAAEQKKRVLSQTEYDFLKQVEDHPIVVLIGSAGTGKSTLLALLDEATGSDMNVGAFIGRAAKNVAAKVKCKVNTLHSLIAQRALRFKKFHVFAFDEAGTVQERLMMKFFSGGWYAERLVLVGDINQIPPFGSYRGNVLFECMQAFPVFELTVVHRQSRNNPECKILHNAYRVLAKEKSLAFDAKSFRLRTNQAHLDLMIQEYAARQFENVQFICGTNAHCFDINQRAFHELTQGRHRELSRDAALNAFTPGLRIVFAAKVSRMRSDAVDAYFNQGYYAQSGQVERESRDLFVNGEQDTIDKLVSVHDLREDFAKRHVSKTMEDAASQALVLRNRVDIEFLRHQERMKKDPVGAALESHRFPADGNVLAFLRSGRVVRMSDCFLHGYAVTVNKLQGGEDKHIVLYAPGYRQDRFLVKYFSVNHLYTAITRATESFTFFGDGVQDLLQMIQTEPPVHYCYFRLWLREAERFLQAKNDARDAQQLRLDATCSLVPAN